MNDFTIMLFSGRLTADPVVFTSKKSGKEMCRFTVATSRRVGGGKEITSYLPVLVTSSVEASNCAKYLSKGREVRVSASFETDSYIDKDNVTRKGFTFVVGRTGFVEFGSGGRKTNSSENEVSVSTKSDKNAAMAKVSDKLTKDSGL